MDGLRGDLRCGLKPERERHGLRLKYTRRRREKEGSIWGEMTYRWSDEQTDG